MNNKKLQKLDSKKKIEKTELIALMAMMFATIAFSIDAMLPSLPVIAAELSPGKIPQAALILTFFIIGMGIGTFFVGPLSDAYGRKPVVYFGLTIYSVGAVLCWTAPTLELMLTARALQGLGAAGPRVVSTAIIRDLYSGRTMASILSFTMMVFLLVPGVAPIIGILIADAFGWRIIFGAFLLFSIILFIWFASRMHETLDNSDRRSLKWYLIADATQQILYHPTVRLSILVQTLMMIALFSVLIMVQPIFEQTFNKAKSFPYWFGSIAVTSGLSSLLNAFIVEQFGMGRIVLWALIAQIIMSSVFIIFLFSGTAGLFSFFIIWQFGVMFQCVLSIANLNAIAMEPMGHIAGMAASVIGSISSILGACVASIINMVFDPSTLVLTSTVLITCFISSFLMNIISHTK